MGYVRSRSANGNGNSQNVNDDGDDNWNNNNNPRLAARPALLGKKMKSISQRCLGPCGPISFGKKPEK
ncbi:MAG: hypothetical protein LBJ18_00425 [Rickettsiales bacterium]|nr:hypothetical protein [Rickettsiales bacterium]